jgi:alkanesulfonate monooxygenase
MLTLYTTCPSSHDMSAADYRRRVGEVARWADRAGLRGILVYADNSLVDPWVVAQFIIEQTRTLRPLVAAQPLYMHPFNVARIVRTLRFLTGREAELNLITGGFLNHMRALGCPLDHDRRYDRLAEYGQVIRGLLTSTGPFDFEGEHYTVHGVQAEPKSEVITEPGLFVSGTSQACEVVQRSVGATRLAYPRVIDEYEGADLTGVGMRLGIIARADTATAWREARRRFPVDRLGEQLHDIAKTTVESAWHRCLSEDADQAAGAGTPYWIYPFRAYATFCPYFVGSYAEVGDLLKRYLALGVDMLILDVPESEQDLEHIRVALDYAASVNASAA